MQQSQPDLVVSLIPNFNRAMYQALSLACPAVPYVTVLHGSCGFSAALLDRTASAQHVICGTPRALAQAQAAAGKDARIHETSGMIISPSFYRDLNLDRDAEMRTLRLDPERARRHRDVRRPRVASHARHRQTPR